MPFWSRGNGEEAPSSKDFTSSDDASFSSGANMMSQPSSSSSSSGAAGASTSELEQFAAAIQQQMIIQETISMIADKAMVKCITKPSDSLSGREAACIAAVTNKWLDTQSFITTRFAKKMQAGQSQSY